ncbi:MAG: hypothetical protein JWN57_1418 [Frankiales bacterium]|nr:hypothetical protein [Frankiales bacterium]
MSGWRRCDRCRRVLSGEEFDGDSTTCRDCLAGPPPPAPKKAKAGPVTRSKVAAARAAVPPDEAGPRRPLLGVAGSGDLEVRERRARRSAQEALAELHPEEFEQLLQAARSTEGLRT